ncbi:MAG: transglutaminase family protein [Chitinophagales bacterium]|nr:transglutaminase family protein [Chitinophagales bacterium]
MFNKFLAIVFVCLSIIACKQEKTKQYSHYEYQMEAAAIMRQPKFYGDSIVSNLLGVNFQVLKVDYPNNAFYFSCSRKDFNTIAQKAFLHKDSIDFGDESGDYIWYGNLYILKEDKYLCRTSISNLNIDTAKLITSKFSNNIIYKINLAQIVTSIDMENQLRGGIFCITEDDNYIVNHSPPVIVKGEPTISKLAQAITKNKITFEDKVQALLDFVSYDIDYNFEEGYGNKEVIKRPCEILLTKNSDCSGKAILFASLLQQIDADWCFLYYPKHITVGVVGNFKTKHPITVNLKGKTYFIAETTDPMSIIGDEKFKSQLKKENIIYYQLPQKSDEIFNYKTKKPLPFVTVKKEV